MREQQSVTVPIRALAFDVDGTIANTDPVHAEAWSRALKSVTGQEFELDAYLEACINGAMTPQQFLVAYCDPVNWPRVERKKRRIYPDLLSQRAVLTAGLADLLEAARSVSVAVAIVSSSSRESVEALLAGPWKSAPPDVVIARGDSSSSKPHSGPYRAAVQRLGIPSELVVAFEDSASGVSAAESAGLTCIQVGLSVPALTEIRIKDFRDCAIACTNKQPCLIVHAK